MEERNVYIIDGEADRRLGEGRRKNETKSPGSDRAPAEVAGAHSGWPRMGASCSMLVSGTGHFLHRHWKAGTFYLMVLCLLVALHLMMSSYWPRLRTLAGRYELGEVDLLFVLMLIDLFVISVLLAGVYTAYALGRAYSAEQANPTPHPIGPALASLLVPGWGQIVNGQAVKSMAFLFATYAGVLAISAWLVVPGPIERLLSGLGEPFHPALVVSGLVTLGVVVWALSLYDAALVARYRRLALSRQHFSSAEPSRKDRRRAATGSRRPLRAGGR